MVNKYKPKAYCAPVKIMKGKCLNWLDNGDTLHLTSIISHYDVASIHDIQKYFQKGFNLYEC